MSFLSLAVACVKTGTGSKNNKTLISEEYGLILIANGEV